MNKEKFVLLGHETPTPFSMNLSLIKFRSFQQRDQEKVKALVIAGLAERFENIDPNLNPDLDDIYRYYLSKGHDFIIAESAENIIGVGGLLEESREIGRIVRVSVPKAHRRKGVGSAIIGHLLRLGQKRHFSKILVETNHDWLDALALYNKCGFRVYDQDDVSFHMSLTLSSK